MLYTTQEIAQIYSSSKNTVSPYMITHTWIPNGLKHIRGKGSGFLYKKEWVEEYLEEQAIVKQERKNRVHKNKVSYLKSKKVQYVS